MGRVQYKKLTLGLKTFASKRLLLTAAQTLIKDSKFWSQRKPKRMKFREF